MDRLIRILVISLVSCLPMLAQAQVAEPSIRAVGPVGTVRSGDIIPVQIQLDSAGANINAAEVVLEYPTAYLDVLFVTREQSIFTLWPELPHWDATIGEVAMVGGRPGGLFAQNAAIATVYFRALRGGPITLQFDLNKTAAYLHDGSGTRLDLVGRVLDAELGSDLVPLIELVSTTHPTPEYWSHGSTVHVGWVVEPQTEYSYSFSTDPLEVPDDIPASELGSIEYLNLDDGIYYFVIKQRAVGGPWSNLVQRRFLIDGTPPVSFTIEQLPSDEVKGRTVIAWDTTDATSGVATYQLFLNGKLQGDVTSPLTLERRWRGQQLRVVALDAAGNETAAVWQYGRASFRSLVPWWAILLGLAVGTVIAVQLSRALTTPSRRR